MPIATMAGLPKQENKNYENRFAVSWNDEYIRQARSKECGRRWYQHRHVSPACKQYEENR